MFSYYRSELMGLVPEDPVIRSRRNGGSLVKFSIGVRNGQGEMFYHPVVVKDALAEKAVQHVRKGSVVVAHGFISTFSIVDSEGEERFVQELVLTDVIAFNRHEQEGYSRSPVQEDLADDDLT